ncbi:MAG: hypothetical protein J3K34DRAFT_421318 [Monoraphidium minutum]|nr:MAG: hypothetical protein J3K34DRAFT_421318 [Monoraphidium minutum]
MRGVSPTCTRGACVHVCVRARQPAAPSMRRARWCWGPAPGGGPSAAVRKRVAALIKIRRFEKRPVGQNSVGLVCRASGEVLYSACRGSRVIWRDPPDHAAPLAWGGVRAWAMQNRRREGRAGGAAQSSEGRRSAVLCPEVRCNRRPPARAARGQARTGAWAAARRALQGSRAGAGGSTGQGQDRTRGARGRFGAPARRAWIGHSAWVAKTSGRPGKRAPPRAPASGGRAREAARAGGSGRGALRCRLRCSRP